MNVRRQYSLPNCTLVLEGLSEDFTANPSDGRAILSILTNAECQFVGVNTDKRVLQGGRTFFENLVRTVSNYAQECLSGIRHPQEMSESPDRVYLEKADNNQHRLIWYPSADINEPESPVKLELTSVQLFDLVEAINQFFADSRTLPDLTLKLQPVSRRYRQGDEPAVQRIVPFSLGIGTLALCAFIFYLIPPPEAIRKPEPKASVSPTPTTTTTPPGASPTPSPPQ